MASVGQYNFLLMDIFTKNRHPRYKYKNHKNVFLG